MLARKSYRPSVEFLEDRLCPDAMLFNAAVSALWSDAGNWTRNGQATVALPQATDDVALTRNCNVDLAANTTIRSLTIGNGQGGPTVNLGGAFAGNRQLIVTGPCVIENSTINAQTQAGQNPANQLVLLGNGVIDNTSFNGYVDGQPRGCITVGGAGRFQIEGATAITGALAIGTPGGAQQAFVAVDTRQARLDLGASGVINVRSNGVLVLRSGGIVGDDNANPIYNRGEIRLNLPQATDQFVCTPVIEELSTGRYLEIRGTFLAPSPCSAKDTGDGDKVDASAWVVKDGSDQWGYAAFSPDDGKEFQDIWSASAAPEIADGAAFDDPWS